MVTTRMAFEKQYSDGSGVEFAIRYNEHNLLSEIEIEHVNAIDIPIDKLDWLIAGLQRIRDEVSPNAGVERHAPQTACGLSG